MLHPVPVAMQMFFFFSKTCLIPLLQLPTVFILVSIFCGVERNIILVDLFPILGVVDANIVAHTAGEYTHICILITLPTIPEVRLRVFLSKEGGWRDKLE